MSAAARLPWLSPSHCTSMPPLSPLLASTRRRQFHAALESAFSSTMMLVLENGALSRDKSPLPCCSRPTGCGWHTGAVGRRPAGRRENSAARPAGVSRVNPKRGWFHRRFHSGNNRNSVPLRELPPQRGPRQFSVERFTVHSYAPSRASAASDIGAGETTRTSELPPQRGPRQFPVERCM